MRPKDFYTVMFQKQGFEIVHEHEVILDAAFPASEGDTELLWEI